jgi:hypothetical protein
MRCSWPIFPSEPPERVVGRHHTRPLHAHVACESASPPKTIRACLAGALLPGVVISRHLLAAARRYRPKAQQLHRTRDATGGFEEVPSDETPGPFRGEAEPHGSPLVGDPDPGGESSQWDPRGCRRCRCRCPGRFAASTQAAPGGWKRSIPSAGFSTRPSPCCVVSRSEGI